MNKKKLLALLMALVMTLTLVPVTALADDETESETYSLEFVSTTDHQGNKGSKYVLNGGGSASLTEIAKALGIGALVGDYSEFSIPENSCVTLTDKNGDYTVAAVAKPNEAETISFKNNGFRWTISVSATETTWSGTGSSTDPYQIANVNDLQTLASKVNAGTNNYSGYYFQLAANLDLGSAGSWTPIGTSTNKFSGTFDGQSYTISNLTINNASLDYAGLFGCVNGELKNLKLSNVSITAKDYVGAASGSVNEGSLTNVDVSDVTINGGKNVGGVAGHAYRKSNGVTNGCDVSGTITITGTEYAGGVVGNASAHTFISCSVIGTGNSTITGAKSTGGICGLAADNGSFTSCSVSGVTVTSSGRSAGGITGRITGSTGGVNACSVTNTNITGGSDAVNLGLLVGDATSSVTAYIYQNNMVNSYAYYGEAYTFALNGNYSDDLPTVYYSANSESNVNDNTVSLSKGTFNADPSTATPGVTAANVTYGTKSYVASGYTAVSNDDNTWTVQPETAKVAAIGETKYETLADAINAAEDGDTVKLLQNVTNGGGVQVSGTGNRTIIIDLDGHTYTVFNKAVGSTGTETQGFQLLKGSNITIKNGTIDLDESAYENGVKRLFNVYCNLTLDGVTVDVRNLPQDYQDYAVNFTNGDSSFINGTKVIAAEGTYPVSVAWWPDGSYTDGAHLNVGTGTEVEGIYFACFDPPYAPSGANATAAGWKSTLTMNGSVERVGADGLDSMQEKDAILHDKITSANASAALPAGYEWKQEGDVYRINKTYVAQIGTTKYATLAEAVEAANSNDTVELLQNIDLPAQVTVNKTLTLDLKGYTISNSVDIWNDNANAKTWSLISVQGGDLTITGNGVLDAKENDCFAADVRDGGKLTIENGTFKGNVSAIYVIEGSATINGGTFSIKQLDPTNKDYRFTLNCFDANRKNGTATITVKGGTFNQFDPSNNLAEGENTNFVADGYETVVLNESNIGTIGNEYIGWYKVGKVQVSGVSVTGMQDNGTSKTYTYTAPKTVVATDENNHTLSSTNNVSIAVTTNLEDDASRAPITVDNIKDMSDFVATVTSKTGGAKQVNVTIQVAKSGTAPVDNTITYEVHPEAIISVAGSEESTTVELTNDQIQGSFTFKLNVGDLANSGEQVTVVHKHANGTSENMGTFKVDTYGNITLTVSSFSEFDISAVQTETDDGTYFKFEGASLRRRVLKSKRTEVVRSSTDVRFGYVLKNYESNKTYYFQWSTDGIKWSDAIEVTKFGTVSGGTYNGKTEASLVITNVPDTSFTTTIYTRIYAVDESGTHMLQGDEKSVQNVITSLKELEDTDANRPWIRYAEFLDGNHYGYTLSYDPNNNYKILGYEVID